MESRLGILLRELRTSRQFTLSHLADKAGVSRMTLTRWELGRFQPRLPEVEAVLQALDASPDERAQIQAQITAPRGVQATQNRATQNPDWNEIAGTLPAIGDLLRALRCRRGLSQEQVADTLKVHRSLVTVWEQSRVALPAERLETLLALLGASPEEAAALRSGQMLLTLPVSEMAAGPDALESQLQGLKAAMRRGEGALLDLRFLTLEAQLWFPAQKHSACRTLLAETYCAHGRWLWWHLRLAEAERYIERAGQLLAEYGQRRGLSVLQIDALHITAGLIADRETPTAWRIAQQHLHDWLPSMQTPEEQAVLLRDMADYLVRASRFETALDCIRRAAALAERVENADLIERCRIMHANVLRRAGRPGEALLLLRTEDQGVSIQNMHEAFQWCQTLAALGERAEAAVWLHRAESIIEDNGLTAFRPSIPFLARQIYPRTETWNLS